MAEYAPNSHKSKAEKAEVSTERKVEKVIKGKAKTRKNGLRTLTDTFISEDATNVKSYVIMDVLVPAVKKAISDIVTDGIDMILYGSTGGRNSKRKSGNRISYGRYYDDPRDDDRRRSSNARVGGRFDYDDIVFDSRGDAEIARERMVEMIDWYGVASVADMYDAAGLTAPYTSNKYGWTNLRNAEVIRSRDGFILKLPKVKPID